MRRQPAGAGTGRLALSLVLVALGPFAIRGQVACDTITTAPAVGIDEFRPVAYQTVHWTFGFGAGVDPSYSACLSHWEFRYRSIEDYDYLDNPTDDTKIWWATLLLPATTLDYAAVVSIPGLIMEGAVRPVFDNGVVGAWAAEEITAGFSPIWEAGFDANTAGVGQDEACPSTRVLYSSRYPVAVAPVNMSEPLDEVVVPRGETMILDASTPRIRVVKVFGCLEWDADADGLELIADKVLVVGKFLMGSEVRPFEHKATITLAGHRPEETASQQRTNRFVYPDNCDVEIESGSYTGCDYTAEWTFEGDPAEIGTTVRFELCTAESDVSDGLGFWTGIGFSSDGSMANSDMLVCQFQQDGSLEPLDAWATGYTRPEQDYDCNDGVGCEADLEVVSSGTEDGRFYCCTIRREMFTQDDKDADLSTEMRLLFAKGRLDENDLMLQHTYFEVSESLMLAEGTSGGGSSDFYGIIGTKALVVYGGATLELHGAEYTSWTVLGSDAARGDTSITLADRVRNWQPGDNVYVAPSGWKDNRDNTHGFGDMRVVESVSGDGRTVTFTQALSNNHFGAVRNFLDDRERVWDYDVRAEVGNLNRNVLIRGDDSSPETKLGGHTMYLRGSLVKIKYVEYARMGQRDTLSRYPVHFHLHGDASRSVVKGLSIHNTYFRSVTMHGVQRLTVEDVFIYNAFDRNFWFEEGSETENTLRHCWVHGGREGVWYENPYNHVIDSHFSSVDVCFDFPLDNGNAPAVDFGTFENHPRLFGQDTVNGMIIPVGSKRVIGTVTWPFGRNEGNTCHTATRVYDQWRHMYSCHDRFVWQCGWADSPMMTHNYVGLTVYKSKLTGGGYFSGYNRYTDNRWADICSALRSGGGKPGSDFVYDEVRGLYNARTVWERSSFIYDSELDIGSVASVKCRTGAWGHDASLFRSNSAWLFKDSYINGNSRDAEHRALYEAIAQAGRGLRRMFIEGTTLGADTPLMVGPDLGARNPGQLLSRFGFIDLDGVLAAQLLDFVDGPFGPGSHIMPYTPTLFDRVACRRSPLQEEIAVCHPELSFEFFELIVGRSDPGTTRRQSIRYERTSDDSFHELQAHDTGSYTSTDADDFWRYSIYFPINGPRTRYTLEADNPSRLMLPGTSSSSTVHRLTFVDALAFTSVLLESESCDVSPGYIEIVAGGGWWPSDEQIRHRFEIRIQGYGRFPAIRLEIPSSAFEDQPVLSQDTGYVLVKEGYGEIRYDPDTRYMSFELSHPFTQLGFGLTYGSGAVYDKDACLAAKGETEWALLSTVWSPNSRFSLSWQAFGTDGIEITMKADTGGWLAFGIAAGPGSMAPADVWMCSHLSDGSGYASDRTNVDTGEAPVPDSQQDIVFKSSSQGTISSGPETTCVFTRKLDTGDEDDNVIEVGELNVIWAFGEDTDEITSTSEPKKHVLSGSGTLNFFTQVIVDDSGRRHLRQHDGTLQLLDDQEQVLLVKDIGNPLRHEEPVHTRMGAHLDEGRERAAAADASTPAAPASPELVRPRLRVRPAAEGTAATELAAASLPTSAPQWPWESLALQHEKHRSLIDQDTTSDTNLIGCNYNVNADEDRYSYCDLDVWDAYRMYTWKCWDWACVEPRQEYTGMQSVTPASSAAFVYASGADVLNTDGGESDAAAVAASTVLLVCAGVGGFAVVFALGVCFACYRRRRRQKQAAETTTKTGGAPAASSWRTSEDSFAPVNTAAKLRMSHKTLGRNPIFRPRTSQEKAAMSRSSDVIIEEAKPEAVHNRGSMSVEGTPVRGAPDWYAFLDDGNNVYYYNIQTRVSSWDRPMASTQSDMGHSNGPPRRVPPSPASASSPPSWKGAHAPGEVARSGTVPRGGSAPSHVEAFYERRRSMKLTTGDSAGSDQGTNVRAAAAALETRNTSQKQCGSSAPPTRAPPSPKTPPRPGTPRDASSPASASKRLGNMGRGLLTAMGVSPSTSPSSEGLPAGWEALRDVQGRTYYYQRATQASQWNRPRERDPAVAPAERLPAGWTALHDAEGSVYYHQASTGQVQWARP